jgi:hypothetical protein
VRDRFLEQRIDQAISVLPLVDRFFLFVPRVREILVDRGELVDPLVAFPPPLCVDVQRLAEAPVSSRVQVRVGAVVHPYLVESTERMFDNLNENYYC